VDSSLKALVYEAYKAFIKKLKASIELSKVKRKQSPISNVVGKIVVLRQNCFSAPAALFLYLVFTSPLRRTTMNTLHFSRSDII
jgi:hypothetical protein